MALGFSKPKYTPIGIDFGSDSLKLMQLTQDETPRLVALASTVIPSSARAETGARMRFLADALNNMLKDNPFKGRRAICSIPAFETLIQHIELDKADPGEIDSQVGLQLLQRLDVDPAKMVVRNHNVGKAIRNGKTLQQVVCIAAKREVVMRYIDLANRCKLEVVGMHSEPMAIVRAQPRLTQCRETTCCIDIGGGITKLVVAHDDTLAFAKTIHASGEDFTCAFAKENNLEFDEARTRRVQRAAALAAQSGAEPETTATTATAVDDDDENGQPTIAQTIEAMIDELRLSLRYYETIFPEKPVRKLVFLGGESQDIGVCKELARSVGLAAQLGDPLLSIDTLDGPAEFAGGVGDRPRPEWAVSMGLCFSEANL